MNPSQIPQARLAAQQIAAPTSVPRFPTPAQIVSWMGAIQAQDYHSALWSLGLRLPGTTAETIEQTIADKTIVRTWPMRGTLHYVAAEDARWMLALMTPRVLAGMALRSQRLELDAPTFTRSFQALTDALQDGEPMARKDVLEVLERAGVSTANQRGYHLLCRAAQEGLICQGPVQNNQQTFVLLDAWLPPGRTLSRDESLAEIARRYFTSHGPATLQDFLGWTGLTAADGRAALAMAAPHLAQLTVERRTYWLSASPPELSPSASDTYLLPGFDEYILGYKDRSAVLAPAHADKIIPGSNGIFMPTLVINGQVVGTWKRVIQKKGVTVTFYPFAPLTKAETEAAEEAADRYRAFVGLPSSEK